MKLTLFMSNEKFKNNPNKYKLNRGVICVAHSFGLLEYRKSSVFRSSLHSITYVTRSPLSGCSGSGSLMRETRAWIT